MKLAIASDHGGIQLKEFLKDELVSAGYDVNDLGTYSEDSVDYPVYGKKCAECVASGNADCGIVCCGTGIGISIAANKIKGIRCALCTSPEMSRLAKEHNNANMLALGGRVLKNKEALEITNEWLNAEFLGDRHKRRTDMLDSM